MIKHIRGLHHVTSMASDARANNAFFTHVLGLRRVKKTVNFDQPDVYHLYYGDELGSPGSVMTYFPFPNMDKGAAGVGEVSVTTFGVPDGALPFWKERLLALNISGLSEAIGFGVNRLEFDGPDGERLALVEDAADLRAPWADGGVHADVAIRGFHSASMRVRDEGATGELLQFMGYQAEEQEGAISRFRMQDGDVATIIDVETLPGMPMARSGAGSVHHIAFAVENRAAQLEVRKQLLDTGYQVTPVIDRDYFWAIYFRTPAGILFEIATNEPGFDRDEERAHLGETLKLPAQHAHLRAQLEAHLQVLE